MLSRTVRLRTRTWSEMSSTHRPCSSQWAIVAALGAISLSLGCGSSTSSIVVITTTIERRTIEPLALQEIDAERQLWDEVTIVPRTGPAVTLTNGRVGRGRGMVVVTPKRSDQVTESFPIEDVLEVRVRSQREEVR